MKILQVVDDFPPCIAGDGIHVNRISKELVKRGHDVTVFTTFDRSINSSIMHTVRNRFIRSLYTKMPIHHRQEKTDGVRVERFSPLFRVSYFSFAPQLCTALLREDFDLVHIHRYFSLLSYPAMLMSKLKGRPIIFTAHSPAIRERKSTLMMLMKEVFDRTWGRSLLRLPDSIIALTQDNVKDYLKLGAEVNKIRLIPNGIDLERFRYLPDPSKFRQEYEISGEFVLFVGRLVKYKGVQYLLQIAPKILKEVPEAKFVIVGPDYGYKNELIKLRKTLRLQKSVVFAGAISEHELLEAYAAADVLVFPSIHEGFGLVLLEAMACRKPIVTWKTSAMQHIVKDRESGILVNPWNLSAFAQSIISLLSNKRLATDMGEKGRKIVEREFEWKGVVSALEAVYDEVIAE